MDKHRLTHKVLIALPIVVSVILVSALQLDYPLYDYWSMLAHYTDLESSVDTALENYLTPFGDAIMLGSSIFIDAFSHLTGGRYLFVHSLFGIACVLLGLILIQRVITEHGELESGGILPNDERWLKIVASALLFWPANIVLFQHHWYALQYGFVYACGIGGLYLLSRRNGRLNAAGVAVLAFGALSHTTVAVLLPCAALCYLLWKKPGLTRAVVPVTLVCVFSLVIWLLPGRESLGRPPLLESLHQPLLLKYFLYLFAPRFLQPVLGPAVVLILVSGVFLFFSRLRRTGDAVWFVWLALSLWLIATAVMTAVGRITVVGFYIQYWYFFFMVLSWIVCAVVISMLIRHYQLLGRLIQRRHLATAVSVVLAGLYSYGAVVGVKTSYAIQAGTKWSGKRLQVAHYLNPGDIRFLSFPQNWWFLKLHLPRLHEQTRMFPFARLNSFVESPATAESFKLDDDRLQFFPSQDPYEFVGLSIAEDDAANFRPLARLYYVDGDSAEINIADRLLALRYYLLGVLPDDVSSDVRFLTSRSTHARTLITSVERSDKKIERIELRYSNNVPADVKSAIQGIRLLQ